jgi:hypothetical protein
MLEILSIISSRDNFPKTGSKTPIGIFRRDPFEVVWEFEALSEELVSADGAFGPAMAAARSPPLVARKFLRLGRVGADL